MAFRFDPSGKIQSPSREALEAADNGGESIIVLDQGVLADGTPYWAYIAVNPSKYREFIQLSKAKKPKRLDAYGTILKYGFERDIPEAAKQVMKDEYGFDEHYETKLVGQIKAARLTFLKQQESQRIGDIVNMLKKK